MRRLATKEPMLMRRLVPGCCLLLIGQLAASVSAGDPQTLLFLSDEAPVILRLNIEVDGGDYEAPWKQYLDELFRDLDQDGDGTLRGGETARIPTAQQMAQLGFRSVRGDKPPEGDVAKKQLDVYLRNVVGPVFDVWQEAVQNNNLAGAASQFQAAPRHRADENLFEGLDVNQDGSLAAEEFAITAALHKLDLDDDETIGRAELEPTTVPFYASTMSSRLSVGSGPFFHLTPLQSPIAIARKILERYDRDQSSGKDDQLDASEIRVPPATFSVLDADGSGLLDFDEVLHMVRQRTTHLEVTVRMGTRHGIEVVEPDSGLPFHGFLRKEKNTRVDLVMGKTEIEIGPDGDDGRPATGSYELAYQRYRDFDGDKNGYLDESETQRTPFRAAFKMIDRDGNGMIVEKELFAYVKQIGTATRSRISLDIADQGNKLFHTLDANYDQRLTSREIVDARNRIGDWDGNNDQQVSSSEFPRHWRLTVSQGTRNSRPTAFPNPASMQSRTPGPSSGPLWFQKMDRNRDGDVSTREFLGPLDDFPRLDQDGDGLLSLAEAIELPPSK